MTFYERLNLLCTEKHLTPTALSEMLNFSRGSLTAWKNGTTPNSKTVAAIAEYFNVTTDYLLNGTVSTPTVIYTRDPDIEIFERIELLKNEEIRQIVLLLRNADTDDLKRVYGMIELLNIGNKENEKDATTTP